MKRSRSLFRDHEARTSTRRPGRAVLPVAEMTSRGASSGSSTSDLVIRNGLVVTPSRVSLLDIRVSAGTISEIAAPGRIQSSGSRQFDAGGLLVLPGFVDAHVHLREPGLTHKEDIDSATRAAAVGGITTIFAMPFDVPPATTGPQLRANADLIPGKAHVDVVMLGAAGPSNLDDLAGLVEAGAASLEVMLADAPRGVGVPTDHEFELILRAARELGVVVGVYCEDPAIVAVGVQSAADRTDWSLEAFVAARPNRGEVSGVRTAIGMAARTSAAIHLRQLSLGASLELARAARGNHVDITVEVTPHHLTLSSDDAVREGLQVLPPLRAAEDAAALRAGVLDGLVDIVATDHAPHSEAEKAEGRTNAWAAPAGLPGLDAIVAVMFETFGSAAAATIARVCSTNPADRFRLGRKGRIEVGADADFVVVDPSASWTLERTQLQSRGATPPFIGRQFGSSVRATFLRGRLIASDREVTSEASGEWIRGIRHSRDRAVAAGDYV
jgi:dihydroorotase